MKLAQIMRTNVGPQRLFHRLSGTAEVHDLDPSQIEPDVVYEVTDHNGDKIGEMRGGDLRYLAQVSQRLDLGNIINAFEDGVVVIDANGRICFENDAYSRIIGVPMRKTIGRALSVIEPGALLLRVLRTGQPLTQDRQLIRSVGKYVAVRMRPILRDGQVVGAFSVFRDVTELNELGREVRRMAGVAEEYGSRLGIRQELARMRMVGRGPAYARLIDQAATVAPTDVTVLIRGENGVGKEVIAKFIHQNSHRRDKPLITVNCAAIPESLIESELFGYEEGSFTGSRKGGKVGKFELAQGGTLFLDEIGDMPLTMQTKLLRVLQEGEIEKIGREANIPVDVRVLAATNQPLEHMIGEKKFRQDLYYRLNVISLTIPPLRERREDILPLTNHFLKLFNKKYGKDLTISAEVYDLLERGNWPGNIRQLRNCVESSVIMCPGPVITPAFLPAGLRGTADPASPSAADSPRVYGPLREELERYERQVIAEVLGQCGGDREEAVRRLGISRRTFYRKLSDTSGT